MLIEDDAAIRDVFGELLELHGYCVLAAVDGAHALSLLQRHEEGRPDVIILDMLMPGMDGYAFLKHCRGEPAFANIPIVVVSATEARPDGARAFLRKPCNPDALLELLDSCLGWLPSRRTSALGKVANHEACRGR